MTKKLEEVFNLPPMDLPKDKDDTSEYSEEEIHEIMERADKIDAALPQVSGLDNMDADYDTYADKAISAFDDLVDLSKNVEDRHAADIAQAASSMLGNALTAKTNKAQKKLDMVKLQLQKEKIDHEKEKLAFQKERYLKDYTSEDTTETEGRVIATRNDMLNEILEGMKKDNDS